MYFLNFAQRKHQLPICRDNKGHFMKLDYKLYEEDRII